MSVTPVRSVINTQPLVTALTVHKRWTLWKAHIISIAVILTVTGLRNGRSGHRFLQWMIYLPLTMCRPDLRPTPAELLGRPADQSSSCKPDVKNWWSCTSTLQWAFMAWKGKNLSRFYRRTVTVRNSNPEGNCGKSTELVGKTAESAREEKRYFMFMVPCIIIYSMK